MSDDSTERVDLERQMAKHDAGLATPGEPLVLDEPRQADRPLHYQAELLSAVKDAVIATNKEMLEKIFDHLPVMINFTGEDGQIKLVNREWERVLGWSQEEIRQNNLDVFALCYPDPQVRQRVADFVAEAKGEWADFKTKVRDGRVIDTTWCRVRLSDGTTMGIGQDISERKRAEDALRRSEEKFRALFDIAPVGISVLDQDRRIVDLNPALEQIVRMKKAELLAGAYRNRAQIRPDGSPMAQRDKASERAIRENRPIHGVESGIVMEDGQCIWVQVNAAPLHLPDASAVVITQDVTERKQAEAALKLQAERALLLADITKSFAEAGLDAQGVLRTVARRVAESLGDSCVILSFSDGQFSHPVAFHHPDAKALALLQDGLRRAFRDNSERGARLRAGEPVYVPLVTPEEFRASADPIFWPYIDHTGVCSLLAVPLRIPGRVIGSLAMSRDRGRPPYTRDDLVLVQALADRAALTIQNAKLFQSVNEQRERLAVLSGRLAESQESERRAIARELHDEIGQVLYAVSANLQSIQISSNTAILADRLQDSVKLVDEALRQIRDLALDLRPSMLDDFGLVPALEWFVDRQAQRSGFSAKLAAEMPETRLPQELETAVFRVAQIALTNVARHARAKQVQIDLLRGETDLELAVRDDGHGFDVPAALERAARGATLGLLSMQERVRLANGTLEIVSAPGQGTTIRARFPIQPEPAP